MCFVWVFQLLILFSIFTENVLANEAPLGILVQVTNKAILNSKELNDLIKNNNLVLDRFYPSLKVQSYKFKKNYKKDLNELKLICTKIKKINGVELCEANLPLKPGSTPNEDVERCDPPTQSPPILNTNTQENVADVTRVVSTVAPESCDLFTVRDARHDYRTLSTDPNLTPFWAQEYIGSDLLREEMSRRRVNTSNALRLLGIWDDNTRNHGDHVSNLIAGPYASALVNHNVRQGLIGVPHSEDYLRAFELVSRVCESNSRRCPRFINNSMKWEESDLVRQTVARMSTEIGSLFIVAAGNDSLSVESVKTQSVRDGHAILVASHAPNGLSSDFTSFAAEVTISAPSDYRIISFRPDGNPVRFGGTSGAAPLVTSTLLAFRLISGIDLSNAQYTELLRRTAIVHRDDPARRVTGAGYLNSYKMGALAFRLSERCGNIDEVNARNNCVNALLENDDFYDFSNEINENEIIQNVEALFPGCRGASNDNQAPATCLDRKNALRELRRASFLMPERQSFWEKIACISREQGFSTNAEYYSRLARGRRILISEANQSRLSNADIADLMISNESLRNNREFILAAVRSNTHAFEYASEALRNDREFVLTAVTSNGAVLQYASEALKNDSEFVLAAVRSNWLVIQYASEALRGDREIVLAGVNSSGYSLAFASEALRGDREIVLVAVTSEGSVLQYASEVLRNDRELVLAAVRSNPHALQYASSRLQNDPELIALSQNRSH